MEEWINRKSKTNKSDIKKNKHRNKLKSKKNKETDKMKSKKKNETTTKHERKDNIKHVETKYKRLRTKNIAKDHNSNVTSNRMLNIE